MSALCGVFRVWSPGQLGSGLPVRYLGALCIVCRLLGHLLSPHRRARSVRRVACAVSWRTRLLFTGVPARGVLLRVRCFGPLGPCSPLYRSVRCVSCLVSWATWVLFTGVPARGVVLCVRSPWPLASYSPLCPLGALCCMCGLLGHLKSVHWCACPWCSVACAVSWATWPMFTAVPLGAVCFVSCLLGHLASVHRCARPRYRVVCVVSLATWLVFTGVPARCVVLRVWFPGSLGFCFLVCLPGALCCVWCPGPLGSCSAVCMPEVRCCVCGVLGHLAPVHRCDP